MAEPWIRVHANLAHKPVVQRAMDELQVSRAEAMGLLVVFWGSVSQFVPGGIVAPFSDGQLEDWARWTRKKGKFAAFIRRHHLDADGRVNEWDDYQGALEDRREKDRTRQQRHRARDVTQPSRVTDSDKDSGVTREVTRMSRDTIRDDTKRDREDDPREIVADPTALPIVIAVAANQAVTARWGEQLHPYTPAAATELAQAITEAGIEHDVARDSIARQCRESKLPRPPKSPAYFRPGIIADWDETLAKRQLAAAPPLNGNGTHPPSRSDDLFDCVLDIMRWVQAPGHAGHWVIPLNEIKAMWDADTLAAITQCADRFRGVKAGTEKEFFAKRDFAKALEAQHVPA